MTFKMHNAWSLTGLNKAVSFSVLIGIMVSCSDVQEREKPDKLLPKSKMVEIYTDMVLLDAVNRTNAKKFKNIGLEAPEHIYNKFDIDSTTLADNMSYYNLDFEANAEIYEQVRENIENRKEHIDSIVKLKDSLKKREKQKNLKLNDSLKEGNSKKLKSLGTDTIADNSKQVDKK